ncbi:hypothetical protein DASC09_005680 [Saccharomycopsis crataegensis]|uniref:NADH-ubiquinone oxidoreductase 21 kDa subunit n=1 Tax=Saccharomycopsis crataegensis TaxID=43959 RepID=A0AAV5QEH4_9ASCO|nr:hypothetical protein DASC09_005680 [Saccharomycopsis crataegensis]
MSNPAPSTSFTKIDTDPEFSKVVRYFRSSDYGVIAASTFFFPALLTAFEKAEPVNGKSFKRPPASILRLGGLLGLVGGFFIAYNRSTQRFWGWSENSRELAKYKAEIKSQLIKGEPAHGKSSLSPWLQDIANRNSQNSQVMLSVIPWFNFVKHPYHGNEKLIEEIKAEIASEQKQ